MTISDDAPASESARRQWLALAVLALPCMLVTMDLRVLFLAVPKITADVDPSSTELLWMTDTYLTALTAARI